MRFLIDHTIFGFCIWWDIAAVILFLGVLIFSICRIRKMKKLKKELEDQVSALSADSAIVGEEAADAAPEA